MTSKPEDREVRHCTGCDITDMKAVLFDIILPPLVKHRQYLCQPCLSVAIDNSKKNKQKQQS